MNKKELKIQRALGTLPRFLITNIRRLHTIHINALNEEHALQVASQKYPITFRLGEQITIRKV